MTDRDATTTFLVCFSGQGEGGHGTGVRICLGGSPAGAADHGEFFFSVTLDNLQVQLPNPLPGAAPVVGATHVHQNLALSAGDIANLRAWLDEHAPAPAR